MNRGSLYREPPEHLREQFLEADSEIVSLSISPCCVSKPGDQAQLPVECPVEMNGLGPS